MRQIVINELLKDDLDSIGSYLKEHASPGGLDGIFWLSIPNEYLAEAQMSHAECGPFVFGIEVGQERVSFELLVRNTSNLHCSCTTYATTEQRDYLLRFVDDLIEQLKIKV